VTSPGPCHASETPLKVTASSKKQKYNRVGVYIHRWSKFNRLALGEWQLAPYRMLTRLRNICYMVSIGCLHGCWADSGGGGQQALLNSTCWLPYSLRQREGGREEGREAWFFNEELKCRMHDIPREGSYVARNGNRLSTKPWRMVEFVIVTCHEIRES